MTVHRHSTVESSPRRGIAAVWAVIVLGVLSVVLAGITAQLLSNRRTVDRQQVRAQGLWLARSGAELAAGRLLSDPDGYKGESPELLPEWKLHVEVRAEGSGSKTYAVTSTASRRPRGDVPTECSVSRRFRRSVEGGRARLEAVP